MLDLRPASSRSRRPKVAPSRPERGWTLHPDARHRGDPAASPRGVRRRDPAHRFGIIAVAMLRRPRRSSPTYLRGPALRLQRQEGFLRPMLGAERWRHLRWARVQPLPRRSGGGREKIARRCGRERPQGAALLAVGVLDALMAGLAGAQLLLCQSEPGDLVTPAGACCLPAVLSGSVPPAGDAAAVAPARTSDGRGGVARCTRSAWLVYGTHRPRPAWRRCATSGASRTGAGRHRLGHRWSAPLPAQPCRGRVPLIPAPGSSPESRPKSPLRHGQHQSTVERNKGKTKGDGRQRDRPEDRSGAQARLTRTNLPGPGPSARRMRSSGTEATESR